MLSDMLARRASGAAARLPAKVRLVWTARHAEEFATLDPAILHAARCGRSGGFCVWNRQCHITTPRAPQAGRPCWKKHSAGQRWQRNGGGPVVALPPSSSRPARPPAFLCCSASNGWLELSLHYTGAGKAGSSYSMLASPKPSAASLCSLGRGSSSTFGSEAPGAEAVAAAAQFSGVAPYFWSRAR